MSGAPGALAPRGRHRLMVVDPAEAPRTAIADFFRAQGWEVLVAADGAAALARTLTEAIDVVLMNVALPGLDGYEVAAILSRLRPRPQIFLTAEADAEAHPRERQHLARFRCFPRPLDFAEIARAIEEGREEAE